MQPLKWLEWLVVGSFLAGGFYAVGRWQNYESATLLLIWLPVLYGLATLISRRAQTVEELRSTPMWFAVSQCVLSETTVGGNTRSFNWLEELATVLPIVVEMNGGQALALSQRCREYVKATRRLRGYFAVGWIGAVALSFFLTLIGNIIVLAIASVISVSWGVGPKWEMSDRAGSIDFVCPTPDHIHVYDYQFGVETGYLACVCGKTKEAREPQESIIKFLGISGFSATRRS